MNLEAQHWIAGQWLDSADGKQGDSVDPANGLLLGHFSDGGSAEVELAILAAKRAFECENWSHEPRLRESVLLQFADKMQSALPELAQLLTADNGKLLAESMGELRASVSELRYYAGLSRNIFGRTIELEQGLFSNLIREPLGLAGIIVPWNAPVILMIRSLAPALAAGCTAIVKNAPQTALISQRIFRLLAEVTDLPTGVVNCFTETGSEGSRFMVDSVDVDVISYTGSTGTGKQIMAAGAKTLKRMNLELGGSAPCLVFEDADLQWTIPALVKAGMFMAGQYCCSATRVLAHRNILDQVQAELATALAAVKVGPGSNPGSQMGPLIDRAGRERVMNLLDRSAQCDELICRGEVLGGELQNGFFLAPSLVHARSEDSPMYTEEVFGPVLVIDEFSNEEEAISKANASRYGLAASVWTADLKKAHRVANRIQSGTVWLNSHGRTFAEVENGGYKESGLGRLHGVEGMGEFLQTKHISWSTNGH